MQHDQCAQDIEIQFMQVGELAPKIEGNQNGQRPGLKTVHIHRKKPRADLRG